MVEEAQGLRARVLADLSKRRKVLHAQIEQLRAGRERLAETVQEVRRSIDAIAEDLFAAEDNARLAAEEAGRQAAGRPDEGTPEEVAAPLLAEEAAAWPRSCALAPEPSRRRGRRRRRRWSRSRGSVEVARSGADPRGATGPAGRNRTDGAGSADDEGAAEEESGHRSTPSSPRSGPPRKSRCRAVRRRGRPEEPPVGTELPTRAESPPRSRPTASAAEGMRTRPTRKRTSPPKSGTRRRPSRRAHRSDRDLAGPPAQADASGQPERTARQPPVGWIPLVGRAAPRRDRACRQLCNRRAARPGTGRLGRRLLHRSRGDRAPGPTCWWGSPTIWPRRWSVRCAGGSWTMRPGLADAEEAAVAEHVGSAFREWKGERIERLAGDHVVAAFSAGTMAALADAADLEWVAVAGFGDAPCPDCEDNGLSGAQQPGQEFPTGHLRPPAHPGCRCLLRARAT